MSSAGSTAVAWRSVLDVVYLVFNEGYVASSGDTLVRQELCVEAIRLARLLVELMAGYHLFHATRADLLRRLGRNAEAAAAYDAALALTANQAERQLLATRRDALA